MTPVVQKLSENKKRAKRIDNFSSLTGFNMVGYNTNLIYTDSK